MSSQPAATETAGTLVLQLPEEDADERRQLLSWLEARQLDVREQGTARPDPRGQAHGFLTVLLLVLGTKAVAEAAKELAKALSTYIEARRPQIKLTIATTVEGEQKLTIDLKNPQSVPELENKLLAFMRSQSPRDGGGVIGRPASGVS